MVPICYNGFIKSTRFLRLPVAALAIADSGPVGKEGALRTMPARQVVLLTPSESSAPTQLLCCQHLVRISPLAATLMDLPASVANKRLTAGLSPLDATLPKNRGVGVTVNPFPADLKVPTCISHSGTQSPPLHNDRPRPFFSFTYELPIFYLLCFDIHASDGVYGGCVCPRFAKSLTHRPHGVRKYRTR